MPALDSDAPGAVVTEMRCTVQGEGEISRDERAFSDPEILPDLEEEDCSEEDAVVREDVQLAICPRAAIDKQIGFLRLLPRHGIKGGLFLRGVPIVEILAQWAGLRMGKSVDESMEYSGLDPAEIPEMLQALVAICWQARIRQYVLASGGTALFRVFLTKPCDDWPIEALLTGIPTNERLIQFIKTFRRRRLDSPAG